MMTKLLALQKKYAIWIVLLGVVLSVVSFPRAKKLLSTIKTDLIHLLPEKYPSVKQSQEVKKTFNKRSRLHLLIYSPDAKANERALMAVKGHVRQIKDVGLIEYEKKGYDFFDAHKLMLLDYGDLQKIHDRLDEKIQKEKLGGLYIDLEDEEGGKEESFEDYLQKYKEEFTSGVQSRFMTNEDGSVYVLNIYPQGTNESLKFLKNFGQKVINHVAQFDFKRYHKDMQHGFVGAVVTRVDQYDALIHDLKRAALVSVVSIFFLLYAYFAFFLKPQKINARLCVGWLTRCVVPVVLIFLPIAASTLMAFALNSFFFTHLNVVTSFLFAIILGLGVDIGIHLMSRYIQDRKRGIAIDEIHRSVVLRTGKSCALGILTTAASFYVLVLNDFKGFSEFGWIAANGLLVALSCYLVFFPALMLLIDRLGWFGFSSESVEEVKVKKGRQWIPEGKAIFAVCVGVAIFSLIGLKNLNFEWDFGRLKMRVPEREALKTLFETTHGRVNTPAVFVINNRFEAETIKKTLYDRRAQDEDSDTIHFFRSYYDMFPTDQKEKRVLLAQIDEKLTDDAVRASLDDEEKEIVADFRQEIASLKTLQESDVPEGVRDLFFGTSGQDKQSIAYVFPLPDMQLDNGHNASAFYDDVHRVYVKDKTFYGISDAMIFAEVLKTLFKDSKKAVAYALLVILVMISWHFRDVRQVSMVFGGLLCGILWMLGAMTLFDLRLNFYNMIIIPAMIGMGVDNSVHVMHRFEEVGGTSIVEVLRTSGGAALMASLTTILGYSGLCFTNHPGLFSIGLMAIIGMGTCLVGSLLVLPLCLQIFGLRK